MLEARRRAPAVRSLMLPSRSRGGPAVPLLDLSPPCTAPLAPAPGAGKPGPNTVMSAPIQSATSTAVSNFGTVSRIPSRVLGQDDFLKLLMVQMTSQDPLNPKKDTDFIAQMAQFSALEQSRSTQSEMAKMRAEQQVLQANALIGRLVTLQDTPNTLVAGPVDAVRLVGGAPQLVVAGSTYDLSQLLAINQLPANAGRTTGPTPAVRVAIPAQTSNPVATE